MTEIQIPEEIKTAATKNPAFGAFLPMLQQFAQADDKFKQDIKVALNHLNGKMDLIIARIEED